MGYRAHFQSSPQRLKPGFSATAVDRSAEFRGRQIPFVYLGPVPKPKSPKMEGQETLGLEPHLISHPNI